MRYLYNRTTGGGMKKLLPMLICIFALMLGCGANEEIDTSKTELDTSKLECETDINSIYVSFYVGYNYSTAEAINNNGELTLPEFTIEVPEDELAEYEKALSKKEEYEEEDRDCNHLTAFIDYYKICINDEDIFFCDGDELIWYEGLEEIYTAKEFCELISTMAQDYLEENVYMKPFDVGIDTIIVNGDNVDITEAVKGRLLEYNFTKVDIDMDYNEYGNVYQIVMLKDGSVLLLFEDDYYYGYLEGDGYNCYVYIDTANSLSLYEYLENLNNNQSSGFGATDNATVTVCFDGKEYEVSDEISEKIIEMSTTMYYMELDWLTKDYDMGECIIVDIENGAFYIPIERTMGNRYYVANDGNIYLVNSFGGGVESTLFDIVGIER